MTCMSVRSALVSTFGLKPCLTTTTGRLLLPSNLSINQHRRPQDALTFSTLVSLAKRKQKAVVDKRISESRHAFSTCYDRLTRRSSYSIPSIPSDNVDTKTSQIFAESFVKALDYSPGMELISDEIKARKGDGVGKTVQCDGSCKRTSTTACRRWG